jgi:metal-responsive CopG/Arc/MetJ family transcriptional regulator
MKKSIHLEVEPQQLALLDEEKRKTGAPRNELIRRAITSYLRKQDTKKGADHGKQRDDARQSAE